MSDNDPVKRGDVLKVLKIARLFPSLARCIIMHLPAVEPPMSAVEYLQTMRSICEDGRNCGKCPLSYNNNGAGLNCQDYAAYYPEEAVANVEKWAREQSEERSEDSVGDKK